VVFKGKRYDSTAIPGVAHGYQHGSPLTADLFLGGDRRLGDARQCEEQLSASAP